MLDCKGFAHYQLPVRIGNEIGKGSGSRAFITEILTSYYHSPVMTKRLFIKALKVSLPTLPKIKIYTHHRLFEGKAWG